MIHALKLLYCVLNSLGPSDATWQQRTESTFPQVMACCLTAPSHYLNQCLLIINEFLWHPSEGINLRKSEETNQQNKIENCIFKITSRSSRGQWVKKMGCHVGGNSISVQGCRFGMIHSSTYKIWTWWTLCLRPDDDVLIKKHFPHHWPFVKGIHRLLHINIQVSMMTSSKWQHFPHYWPFVQGIHQSLVNSPHKG